MSDAAVVVHSGNPNFSKNGKGGGTWTGALENIKKGWIPLWVKQTQDTQAGNALIVQEGANWLTVDINQIDIEKLVQERNINGQPTVVDMFSSQQEMNTAVEYNPKESLAEPVKPLSHLPQELETAMMSDMSETIYQFFLIKIKPLVSEGKQIDELCELLNIHKSQLNVWLKQAVEEQVITKLNKPVRYKWSDSEQKQGTLL